VAERKKFLLRLDPDVYAAIQRWADDELRSVNAQVEFALRQALRAAGRQVRNPERKVAVSSGPAESPDQEPA
jgi:hypothetical protein